MPAVNRRLRILIASVTLAVIAIAVAAVYSMDKACQERGFDMMYEGHCIRLE